ncbi:hypothetical protein HZ326_27909 [Fusarium oxysporum f. sp. albedinis]|nr:hypothetical protein HZ326_27909 [Fusarium oxysporum f. sp. albedinis]
MVESTQMLVVDELMLRSDPHQRKGPIFLFVRSNFSLIEFEIYLPYASATLYDVLLRVNYHPIFNDV